MMALRKLFLHELNKRQDSETRQARDMPQIRDAATCEHLKELIRNGLEEAGGHVTKLGLVFKALDLEASETSCDVTALLLVECGQVAQELAGTAGLNAALIAAAQKLKHHEIASYGCLREWAGLLGSDEGRGLLDELLVEKKNTNQALMKLARFRCNKEALDLPGKAPTSDCYGHEIVQPPTKASS